MAIVEIRVHCGPSHMAPNGYETWRVPDSDGKVNYGGAGDAAVVRAITRRDDGWFELDHGRGTVEVVNPLHVVSFHDVNHASAERM